MPDSRDLYPLKVAGVLQNGTAATSSMTSDAIEFKQNSSWSLSTWFSGLTVSGANPTITIQVSNNSNSSSFTDLEDCIDIDVADNMHIKSQFSNWKYFRVIYTPNGASAGTKYFDLIVSNE